MNNQELIKYLESKIDEIKELIEGAMELDYMNSLYGRIDGIDFAIKKIKELTDVAPTIKPGDRVRITDAMNRSCIGKEDTVTQISGSAPYSARLTNFLGDWPFSSLEVVKKDIERFADQYNEAAVQLKKMCELYEAERKRADKVIAALEQTKERIDEALIDGDEMGWRYALNDINNIILGWEDEE
ncbi:hypothetical protein [Paenibacillus lautus]|uniref:hypothetical protein n=1 Tax=Paenibacillus lautus TaxID=1401 RepID=UPI001C7D3E57|nr:hypothetical protein [Paenibacillus lautus]MBX4152446.1 hypothetical protein [Paenibacillus lautus]